ncbi:CmpA/NrtA family ABC transporter substrate-binding protein [Pedosphaera parvula]|uniref:Nitrate transporter, putative n=1 Tax=Pedosphaera parvula (strain Ellin514) TaxID=320771 RepID=B9XJ74_PEDPL|nr:CmpA/NrtA family ABC transporter substrate-binding protein [Pedosphaera parvula]EEF60112.1 nitrate transporter, putative [Pedosphaera parvula Ellin514]
MSRNIHTGRSLENPQSLQVGFVPLTDCAPLAIARELGLFSKYNLEVHLRRELGWATIRDKIIHGELDAAHALAGMPFAATLGLGSVACECVTGLVLGLNGNAITLSRELWENGVRDAKSLREVMTRLRGRKVFTFGIPFPFSSHNFLLRHWLSSSGIDPQKDVQIVVVPPPQMFANLKAGNLDGYCVGEPWNSIAVQNRIGWCADTSVGLAPNHPEKVLMVRSRFAADRATEHLALIASLIEACTYCDQPENADHVINVLSRPEYLNIPAASLRRSITGPFDFGHGRTEKVPGFQIFHRDGANEPSAEKAGWVLKTMHQTGVIPNRSLIPSASIPKVFRSDIYQKARNLITSVTNHEDKSKAENHTIA